MPTYRSLRIDRDGAQPRSARTLLIRAEIRDAINEDAPRERIRQMDIQRNEAN